MGAMMEQQAMTITIQIEGHPQDIQEWYERLNAEISEFHSEVPRVFLAGVIRQVGEVSD